MQWNDVSSATCSKNLLKIEHWIYPHSVDTACTAQLEPLDAQLRRRNVTAESAGLRCAG